MSSRQNGKAKPLKQPKKDKVELDDEDVAFKKKQQEQNKAQKDLVQKLTKK